jgi:hypothetical protein
LDRCDERRNDDQHFAILLNLGHAQDEATLARGHVVASTYLDREDDLIDGKISLRPSEGLIVKVARTRPGRIPGERSKYLDGVSAYQDVKGAP